MQSKVVKMKSKNLGLNHTRQHQNKDNALISIDKREKVHKPLSPQNFLSKSRLYKSAFLVFNISCLFHLQIIPWQHPF
jgi:hypothetical protein